MPQFSCEPGNVENSLNDNQPSSSSNDSTNPENGTNSKQCEEKLFQKNKMKTASLNRNNDPVYTATTTVVKAIMSLSQGVEKACATQYLTLVRNVGIQLRTLLSSVDTLASIFPPQAHK